MSAAERGGSSGAGPAPALDVNSQLRALHAVHAVLDWPTLRPLRQALGDAATTRAIRDALTTARESIRSGTPFSITPDVVKALAVKDQQGSLRPVLNATGVIVHTNLGRAPLAHEALQAAVAVSESYSTLEFDLDTGKRGSRHGHVRELLRTLCGAEDACVVNNNAASVLLALSAVAAGREVIVSRGELVEIGGGFRVPDVMQQGGATVVEVGTTNRTHPRDFAGAIGANTGAILKVHQSNFATVGFATACSIEDLRNVVDSSGADHAIEVLYDAGSGCLHPIAAAPEERTIADVIAAGADLVMFSGDKLLGGPQAGILVGKHSLIERCRRHPLMRAMRPDKMCLAALEATLRLWRDRPEAVPVRRMIDAPHPTLVARAVRARDALEQALGPHRFQIDVLDTVAKIGGGTSPLVELKSAAVCVRGISIDTVASALRRLSPPLICRAEHDALLLDFLTLTEAETTTAIAHLATTLTQVAAARSDA